MSHTIRVLAAACGFALLVFLLWRMERVLSDQLGAYLGLLVTLIIIATTLGVFGRLLLLSGLAIVIAGFLSRGPAHSYPAGDTFVHIHDSQTVARKVESVWKWGLVTYILLSITAAVVALFIYGFIVTALIVLLAHFAGWHFHAIPRWVFIPIGAVVILLVFILQAVPAIANMHISAEDVQNTKTLILMGLVLIVGFGVALYGLWRMISAPFRD